MKRKMLSVLLCATMVAALAAGSVAGAFMLALLKKTKRETE